MSGFVGIVRTGTGSRFAESDRSALGRMARAIAFRGPDALQETIQPDASFAFSFLRTGPCAQESSQPCTLDGETWFLGDARCDGREETVRKLAQHGVPPSPCASSEQLVLHYFAKFGEAGLPELHGDFSFALWKPRERTLIAFRDLTGLRPFFYSCGDGVLVFSNTMQAVLSAPWVSRELDEEFLADFLLGSPYQTPSSSVYRGMRRLPPGHLLEFSERGLLIRRIANMPVEDLVVLKHHEEYVEEFRRLFAQSVRDQLPSMDTTILLSGGIDSPTVAACAVALRNQGLASANPSLRALSVDSRPVVDDRETTLASRFAEKLGIPCQVVHSGKSLPFAGWAEAPEPFPEPVLDPYSKLYLSYYRLIAQDSRLALSGSGGDEVLRLQAWPYLRFLFRSRGPLSPLFALSRYLIAQRKLPSLGLGMQSAARRLLGRKSYKPPFPPWLKSDFARRMDLPGRWRSMNLPPASPHPFNPRAYASLNDLSVASALEFYDPTWTACQVESRNPFMDRRLSRFLLRIPAIPWAMDKYLLRRSQIGILPDEIRLRPKTPVTQDILLLHAAAGNWKPAPAGSPPALLHSLVDWPRLAGFLEGSIDDSLYLHLRPVALARWLEIVENRDPVRYPSQGSQT